MQPGLVPNAYGKCVKYSTQRVYQLRRVAPYGVIFYHLQVSVVANVWVWVLKSVESLRISKVTSWAVDEFQLQLLKPNRYPNYYLGQLTEWLLEAWSLHGKCLRAPLGPFAPLLVLLERMCKHTLFCENVILVWPTAKYRSKRYVYLVCEIWGRTLILKLESFDNH